MLREGALDEARAALPHWPASDAPGPMPLWTRAIGAPELIAHLRGQMSLAEAEAAATLATRQYAKRQRTWFRSRMAGWHRVDRD
jgi:tRNA dimethylallyltransferase